MLGNWPSYVLWLNLISDKTNILSSIWMTSTSDPNVWVKVDYSLPALKMTPEVHYWRSRQDNFRPELETASISTIFKKVGSYYNQKNMPRLWKGCFQELYSDTENAEFRIKSVENILMCVGRVEEKECESQMANSRSKIKKVLLPWRRKGTRGFGSNWCGARPDLVSGQQLPNHL